MIMQPSKFTFQSNFVSAQASGILTWELCKTWRNYCLRNADTAQRGMYSHFVCSGHFCKISVLRDWSFNIAGREKNIHQCLNK